MTEELSREENPDAIITDNASGDALLETDEAQMMLETLAEEALAEYRTGNL